MLDKVSKIWLNGNLVDWDDAKIHVLTHALHYGTAVFEGLRCYKTTGGPAVCRLLRPRLAPGVNSAEDLPDGPARRTR